MGMMDEPNLDDYEHDNELALLREYRDVVQQFKYVIETERRFYLANEVKTEQFSAGVDFYFKVTMHDVWVWDVYRSNRFVQKVEVISYKDLNIEERSDSELNLPEELAVGE